MARDISELGADVFDDTVVETKHRISPKKRNYIIGLSCVGVALVGAIVGTTIAANTVLLDYNNVENIQFIYTPQALLEEGEKPTAILYSLDSNAKYPSTFRVPSHIQGYKVVGIYNNACHDHPEIKKLILPHTIEFIGETAFKGCTNLAKISWSRNLTEIGYDAFGETAFYDKVLEDNSSLTKIPNGLLIKVGDDYFDSGVALVSDSLSEAEKAAIVTKYSNVTKVETFSYHGITHISASAFMNNSKVAYIDFPTDTNTIYDYTFKGCNKLQAVDLTHSSISKINAHAFEDCDSLYEFKTKTDLTSVGEYAFSNTGFTTSIPHFKDATIGSHIFSNCANLTSAVYDLDYVPEYMFSGCTNLSSIKWGANNANENNVTSIGKGAFEYTGFTEFKLPREVDEINDFTFRGCENLKTVRLWGNPNEVKSNTSSHDEELEESERKTASNASTSFKIIGTMNAWNYNNGIAFTETTDPYDVAEGYYEARFTATIPHISPEDRFIFKDSDGRVMDYRYDYILSGKNYFTAGETIEGYSNTFKPVLEPYQEESVEAIIEVIKEGDNSVNYLTLKRTILDVYIDKNGNKHYGNLKGISSIKAYAFGGCSSLDTIGLYDDNGNDIAGKFVEGEYHFPASVKSLNINTTMEAANKNTFTNNKEKHVIFSANLTSIGSYAFYNNEALETFEIDNMEQSRLISINKNAFENCTSLEALDIPQYVKTIDASAFKNCSSAKKIDISKSKITSISAELFYGCESLEHLDIPESVASIKERSFKGNRNLDYLIVPNSVIEITLNAVTDARSSDSDEKLPVFLSWSRNVRGKNINANWKDNTVQEYYLLADGETPDFANYHYWKLVNGKPVIITE